MKKPSTAETPLVFHRIGVLLHTIRSIAQHEDQLCTLLHATKGIKTLSPDIQEELRALLDEMPSQEYADDFEALKQLLPSSPTPAKRKRPGKRAKAEAKTVARKSARAVAGKLARKVAKTRSTTKAAQRSAVPGKRSK